MQALKSGHTAHHCGDVAQYRVGPRAEDTPRLYARRLRGRVFKRSPRNFRCDPALSKNYLPFGELFADGFLVVFTLHPAHFRLRCAACIEGVIRVRSCASRE